MATQMPSSRLIIILAWSIVLAATKALAKDARSENEDVPREEAPSAASLEPIIVTARRREESLQLTPVSVVSLSAKELDNRSLTNLRDLQNFVPNLTFAPSQNVGEAAGNAFIRGIGQEDFIAGSEPGVGFYVDGVYLATTRGTLMNIVDVERIEVLRGPQGTLFGRNTIGGAVNVVFAKPNGERTRRAELILGNRRRAELRMVVNEPLTGNLFARMSALVISRDGYLRRIPPPLPLGPLFPVDGGREGDNHNQAARLQLRWVSADGLTADFTADASRTRNNQGAIHVDAIDPTVGIFPRLNELIRAGRLPGPEITADLIPDDFFASLAAGRNFSKRDNWGIGATIANDVRAGTLKLILAVRDLRTWMGTDTDGLYFDLSGSEFRDTHRQYSGEVQIDGSRGRLHYTAGLFALGETARSLPTRSPIQNAVLLTCRCFYRPGTEPRPMTVRRNLSARSYAGYAQGTLSLTERLSATLGTRYSYESKSIRAQNILADPATLEPTAVVRATGANRGHWDALTYRAGLEYQTTADLMAYVSVAKGYKSGGFNVRPDQSLTNLGLRSFGPESARVYEAGLRSEWFDRRLRLNATVFRTRYEDMQLRQQTVVGDVIATLIENAAEARIRGIEVELVVRPTERLTLQAAYGHLDAKYIDVGEVPGITTSTELARTPHHSASGSVQYEFPVSLGTVELQGDLSYRSREQFQLTPRPFDQEGFTLLGAKLRLRDFADRWSIALFGTNLSDEHYRTAGRGVATEGGISFSNVGMPRQVGVQLVSRF